MRSPQAPQSGKANEKGGSSMLPPLKTNSKKLSRHSGAMRSIEPGISRFPDAQLRIRGLVLRTIPE
jgi:hypothetical protein